MDGMIENTKATVRADLSLWQIWQNRNEARDRWFDIALVQYGFFLPEIVVSKVVYRLINVLLLGKGVMASGNWLDIGLTVFYSVALDDDVMMIKDVGGETSELLIGGRIVGIDYDGLKKFVPQKGESNA